MNKNNAKALSTLRQKIRKYNRDFESEIAAYKEVKSKTKSSCLFSMHCMNLLGGGGCKLRSHQICSVVKRL